MHFGFDTLQLTSSFPHIELDWRTGPGGLLGVFWRQRFVKHDVSFFCDRRSGLAFFVGVRQDRAIPVACSRDREQTGHQCRFVTAKRFADRFAAALQVFEGAFVDEIPKRILGPALQVDQSKMVFRSCCVAGIFPLFIEGFKVKAADLILVGPRPNFCLLYTSPSPRD